MVDLAFGLNYGFSFLKTKEETDKESEEEIKEEEEE